MLTMGARLSENLRFMAVVVVWTVVLGRGREHGLETKRGAGADGVVDVLPASAV